MTARWKATHSPKSALAGIALAASLLAAPAAAHEWYTGTKNEQGQSCCGGADCASVPYDAVSCDADGCDVTIAPGVHPMAPGGGTFRFTGNPQLSPDASNHACITAWEVGQGVARCVWIGGAV